VSSQLRRGHQVLLVEDNEINLEIAQELLTQFGLVVVTARHGREALDCLERQPFDLVLMDMQMAVMDGLAATRAIRRDPRWAALPVIAMTANVMPAEIQSCRDAGMNDHLGKPIDVDTLFDTLCRWLPADPVTAVTADAPETAALAVKSVAAAALPEKLAGLDLTTALRRLSGDSALLRKILLKFHASEADVVERIAAALSTGDREQACRHAHTLRGLAASIGADALSDAAKQLEDVLRQGEPQPTAQVDGLRHPLAHVLNAIVSLDHRQPVSPSVAGDVRARLWPALETLQRLLDDDDVAAVEAMEAVAGDLERLGHAAAVKTMETAIAGYDFAAAGKQLANLRSTLDVTV
jgi:CheY-like chemotaxis protein